MSDIQVTVTEVGVNMGDHGQDVTRAFQATPETTLAELVPLLTEKKFISMERPNETVAKRGAYITIRLAEALPEPASEAGAF